MGSWGLLAEQPNRTSTRPQIHISKKESCTVLKRQDSLTESEAGRFGLSSGPKIAPDQS